MHADEDIWEIRKITMRKGMRMTKEVKEVTMGTMVATMAVMMGPVMSQVVMMSRVGAGDYGDYGRASSYNINMDGAGGYDRAGGYNGAGGYDGASDYKGASDNDGASDGASDGAGDYEDE